MMRDRAGCRFFTAVLASLALTGCLPDSDSVRAKKLAQFAELEAASYAAAMSSFAVQSQSTLSTNSAFLDGTMPQGKVGESDDGSLAYGYCRDTSNPDAPNHMVFTWNASTNSDGNFSLKGIGEGAGAGILQALSRSAIPESIGYFDDEGGRQIHLRGPRAASNSTKLALPSGCNLPIPVGAPVILTENLQAPEGNAVGSASFEYRTLACADNQIGAITQRRSIKTLENGTVQRGNTWEPYDDTCGGKVSTRAVQFSKNDSGNKLIGALSLNGDGLDGTLSTLADMDCVQAKTPDEKNKDGKVVEGKETADSCDTENIEIVEYQGPGKSTQGGIESTEQMTVTCGVGDIGDAGTTTRRIDGRSYSGNLNLHNGWQGNAIYQRHTYEVTSDAGDANEQHGESTRRGRWEGKSLLCRRTETLKADCSSVFVLRNFEFYNADNEYISDPDNVTNAGGTRFRRTNEIKGWKTPAPPVPNDPMEDNEGWSHLSTNCAWDEYRTFRICPTGFELITPGKNTRRITAVAPGEMRISEWVPHTSLVCRRTVVEPVPFTPQNPEGGGGGDPYQSP